MGRKRKETTRKEDRAEGCCFFCKDGGLLRVCDYKNCLKGYHPACVKRSDDLLKTDERWFCGWHYCFICGKAAKFQCFTCPIAVCGGCLWDAEYVVVRGKRGFCNTCLELALLIEERKDVNSNGCKVDFNDQDTYEFMFKAYWEVVKGEEGFNKQHLSSAHNLLKKNKNFAYGSDLDDLHKEDDNSFDDDDAWIEEEEHKLTRKRKRVNGKMSFTERKRKSTEMEFLGWASKPLVHFLESVGEEPKERLSEYDVASIVTKYCHENGLFHPERKKQIICNSVLYALFRRRMVNRNSIHKLLSRHFAENEEKPTSDDEDQSHSGNIKENDAAACKNPRQSYSGNRKENDPPGRKNSSQIILNENLREKVALASKANCFASFVTENMKLVYLKRSLVEQLAKETDTFEGKLMGSFVRVKSDPNDYLQKNPHQLVQVTGIKRANGSSQANSEILLQVSNMIYDVPIRKLSDDNFSEEECEDLQRRAKDGLIKRPTVGELEKKARCLHEDLTKHWIARELALLRSKIDQANEKGWRRELSEYMDRLELLRTPAEQSRLLNEVPQIAVDGAEQESVSEENLRTYVEQEAISEENVRANEEQTNKLQEYPMTGTPEASSNGLKSNGTFPCHTAENETTDEARSPKTRSHQVSEVMEQDALGVSGQTSGNKGRNQMEQKQPKAILSPTHSKNGKEKAVEVASEEQNKLESQRTESVENKMALAIQIIDLNSDDGVENEKLAARRTTLVNENPDCSKWYCMTPCGETRGPYTLSLLKEWRDSAPYESNVKVFKANQRPERAVPLDEAIRQIP